MGEREYGDGDGKFQWLTHQGGLWGSFPLPQKIFGFHSSKKSILVNSGAEFLI